MPEGNAINRFKIPGRVAVITGGAGLLGRKHAEAIMEAGGIPVLLDVRKDMLYEAETHLRKSYGSMNLSVATDITKKHSVQQAYRQIIKRFGRIDILINNAAIDPKVKNKGGQSLRSSRFEHFSLDQWEAEVSVGLTGALVCSQIFGTHMANKKKGIILNICSDLAVIAPDQRLYRQPGLSNGQQPVKPVTYSVIKTGLLGLTRYLATYWADQNIRVNAISPGGVYDGQSNLFVQRLQHLIPLGRMATTDEYKAAILFLVSDASSYMTGSNLIIDGGRSCW